MIVVVPTCPAYHDIVAPFIHFFNKHWKDCPYPKYFINGPGTVGGFSNFNTVTDQGWTANLLAFIHSQSVDDNILLLLDDYLLMQGIDQRRIEAIDGFMSMNDEVGYVRLLPYANNHYNEGYAWTNSSKVAYNEQFNFAHINRDPRLKETGLPVSLQPAVWNSTFIKTYFHPAWSPWQQEVLGSRQLSKRGHIRGFKCNSLLLTTKTPVYYYLNGVRDGKYAPELCDVINSTPELKPFKWGRDIAIPMKDLAPNQRKEIGLRQMDGTYPSHRYAFDLRVTNEAEDKTAI